MGTTSYADSLLFPQPLMNTLLPENADEALHEVVTYTFPLPTNDDKAKHARA